MIQGTCLYFIPFDFQGMASNSHGLLPHDIIQGQAPSDILPSAMIDVPVVTTW